MRIEFLDSLLESETTNNIALEFRLSFEVSMLNIIIANCDSKWFFKNYEDENFPLRLVFHKADPLQLMDLSKKIIEKTASNKKQCTKIKMLLSQYVKARINFNNITEATSLEYRVLVLLQGSNLKSILTTAAAQKEALVYSSAPKEPILFTAASSAVAPIATASGNSLEKLKSVSESDIIIDARKQLEREREEISEYEKLLADTDELLKDAGFSM